MVATNDKLTFNDLPSHVRSAFSGIGNKIILLSGTSLFRFSGHTHVSSWWSSTEELAGLLLAAKSSKKGLYNYVRDTTAVLRQWDSEMYNLIVGRLNRSCIAFKGGIAPQNEAS